MGHHLMSFIHSFRQLRSQMRKRTGAKKIHNTNSSNEDEIEAESESEEEEDEEDTADKN